MADDKKKPDEKITRTKVNIKAKDTDVKLSGRIVAKSILESRELNDIKDHVEATRKLITPKQEVRDFVKEIANDEDFAEVIAMKSTEKNFIKALYERTNLTRAEIIYLFGLHATTFTKWRNEEKWMKKITKKFMDRDKLITILFHGEYNLIEVKKETQEQMEKKYNAFFFKTFRMIEGVLADTVPDKYTLEAIEKSVRLAKMCQEGQFEAYGLAPTTKERTELLNKNKEIELKEREVKALERANDLKIVTENRMDTSNKFDSEEMKQIFIRVISETGIDEDQEEMLLNKLRMLAGETPEKIESK